MDGQVFKLSEALQGENAPPLHPRCRCTIAPEVEGTRLAGRTRIPASVGYSEWRKQINLRSEVTGEAPRPLEEIKFSADRLNRVIDKYIVRTSKWSGTIRASTLNVNYKDWNCDIVAYLEMCPDDVILHELLHARSISYYSAQIYAENSTIEEASVQLMTQEIAKLENMTLTPSNYDDWTDILRGFNKNIRAYETDLKFAQRLIRIPPNMRLDWIMSKARKFVEKTGGDLSQLLRITAPLEEFW